MVTLQKATTTQWLPFEIQQQNSLKMNIRHLLLIIPLLIAGKVVAQQKRPASIPIELMFGNERFRLQQVLTGGISNSRRFSFFSVTYVDNNYQNETDKFEFVNISQLAYDLYKGFGVTVGLNANKITALSPTLGIRYTYASPELLWVLVPDYIFSEDRSFATFSLLEFKPKLSNQVRLYSRLQGLYNHNLDSNNHQRSYLQIRLGIGYKRYEFGLAANFDYFGSAMIFQENYGIFIKTNL